MLVRRKRLSHRTKRSTHEDDDAQVIRPGRPIKRTSQLAPSQQERRQQAEQIYALKKAEQEAQQPIMSSLEALPVEIIQHIFFDALEINLARSSRYLSSTLSQPSIYNALILFAYFDDDGQNPVEEKLFRPAEYRQVSINEKLRLQKAILACRWCTLDRIKSLMPVLSRLQMVQSWHGERDAEINMAQQITDDPKVPNEGLREVARLPDLDDSKGMAKHFLARFHDHIRAGREGRLGPTSDYGFLPRIMRWTTVKGKDGELHKTLDGGLSVLAARVIPDRLIDGTPWTHEKIEFLQLLRQGLRFLRSDSDHVLIISAKTLFEGMEQAILEQNHNVMHVLLEIHNTTMTSMPPWPLRASARPWCTPPSPHPIPLRLLHLAATTEPEFSSMMWILLRAGIDSIPKDDVIMTKWALQHSKWLLDHMGDVDLASHYGINRGSALFLNGRVSWRAQGLDFFHADHSFTWEVGYITEGASDVQLTNPDGGPCG